ncbi:hypothetical protein GCM10011390_08240 [Aureimonas endophytica]|uniref:Uncharacterized protein n=1 Tax=Aureimonas endophytica TaxID=2027858 RepID=A0A916ZEC6_9HYPH|nr:hypothetical protein GCM10011390_08240 [Aureimonas endophytica]
MAHDKAPGRKLRLPPAVEPACACERLKLLQPLDLNWEQGDANRTPNAGRLSFEWPPDEQGAERNFLFPSVN